MNNTIFRDAENKMRLETKYPTRKAEYSEPVISSTGMRAYRICDLQTHKTFVLLVEANDLPEKIVLAREEINPRVFERSLSKHGIALTVSRERKKLVLELILSFLIDEAVVIEMPKRLGWNKTDSGWVFAGSDVETMEGVVREFYERN